MAYEILIAKPLENLLKKMKDKGLLVEIRDKMFKVSEDPYRFGKPLTRELSGLFSVRIRNFRLIYTIPNNTKEVLFLAFGNRKDIYKVLTVKFSRG